MADAPISDEERGDLPSLTLIFTTTDKENADWDRLLDLDDLAIDAIEAADPRFSILKAFTFYAGADYMSQAEKIDSLEASLRATRSALRGQAAVIEAARNLLVSSTLGPALDALNDAVAALNLDTPEDE